MTKPRKPVTGLILAAGRAGIVDPVAASQNKSHKCLVEIAGRIMLERVVDSLMQSGGVKPIFVSIEDEAALRTVPTLAQWLDDGTIRVVKSARNLADSVISGIQQIEKELGPDAAWPILVTTGDNALQTPGMVQDFLDQSLASDSDIAMAFTRDDVVLQEHPEPGLAFHRLKDGGFSANNLYLLRSPDCLSAVNVFRSGGQFGKRHIRILKSFGVLPFILYKMKATTGARLLARIGRNLGIKLEMILSPFADGPIDVDNMGSYALCEAILKKREAK
jgi:CTP:molybdopterin cytidylyltransferase MocA